MIHFIRHAEGYHNVNQDYKNPAHIDAQLTPRGIHQCHALSQQLQLKLQQSEKRNESHDESHNENAEDGILGNLLDVECNVI